MLSVLGGGGAAKSASPASARTDGAPGSPGGHDQGPPTGVVLSLSGGGV